MSIIDIIILSYAKNKELKSLTLQTINTLLNSEDHTQIIFNIIVIESNSKLENYQYPGTLTIYPKSKFGYNKYLNIGIRHSSNKFCCICNNDLIFHKNWATEILQAFEKDISLYSASPFCQINQPPRGVLKDTGIFKGYRLFKEISGWCIFFKREVIDIIGKFDENLKFWYVDMDYANLLEKHNLEHAMVTSSHVDHLEHRTMSTENAKRKERLTYGEFIYYDYKWNHKNRLLYSIRSFKRFLKYYVIE